MHQDLVRWFLDENGVAHTRTPSAASLEHFQIRLLLDNIPIEDFMETVIREKIPLRVAAVDIEKAEIESATSSKEIIHYMRRGTDIVNQQLLVRRALEFEDEILPDIIGRLRTSLNDLFIELSARILAICKKDVSEELIEFYDEIRGAYARSMILLALGFKAPEGCIPWVIKQFNELKCDYPTEDFCYGAYFALLEMESRFYSDGRKFSTPPVQSETRL